MLCCCSEEYKRLKEERSQVLWQAVEKIIPDIRQRTECSFVGTPLTQERFVRRHKGSYGPAIKAGEALFPGGSSCTCNVCSTAVNIWGLIHSG